MPATLKERTASHNGNIQPPSYGANEFDELRQRFDELQASVRATALSTATGGAPTAQAPPPLKEHTMDTQTSPPPAGHNIPPLEAWLEEAQKLGAKAGQGDGAGLAYLLKCFEGAYLGALTPVPREGEQEGDQAKLAAAYSTARALTNTANPKASNQKKLKAETKLALETGTDPRFDKGEGPRVTNKLLNTWEGLKKRQVKDLLDGYNMTLRFWRKLKRMDTIPADDELEPFCYKVGPGEVSGVRILEQARKMLIKLSKGDAPNCSDQDNSRYVKDAIGAITSRLTEIAATKGQKPVRTRKVKAAPAPTATP